MAGLAPPVSKARFSTCSVTPFDSSTVQQLVCIFSVETLVIRRAAPDELAATAGRAVIAKMAMMMRAASETGAMIFMAIAPMIEVVSELSGTPQGRSIAPGRRILMFYTIRY